MTTNLKNTIFVIISLAVIAAVGYLEIRLQIPILNVVIALMLVLVTDLVGFKWGMILAFATPVLTYLIGNLGLFHFIISAALGNGFFVFTIFLAPKVIEHSHAFFLFLTPVLGGALLKYYVQFFSATAFIPYLLKLSDEVRAQAHKAFGSTQLLATLIGGIIGAVAVYFLKSKFKKQQEG